MKKFCYTIDLTRLKMSEADIEAATKPKDSKKLIFESNVHMLCSKKYPNGLDNPSQRSLMRILNNLDKAQSDVIDIEDGDFAFLKGLFSGDVAISSDRIRIVSLFEENILEAEKVAV